MSLLASLFPNASVPWLPPITCGFSTCRRWSQRSVLDRRRL